MNTMTMIKTMNIRTKKMTMNMMLMITITFY